MRVHCLQENLARALSLVSRAVAPRTATLPVLTHVLLATDNGRLKVAATNLEVGVVYWIGAKVESDGAITVPARTFSELVSLLPPDKVEMELNVRTQTLRVQCGRADASIKGIDAQEFPIIPSPGEQPLARINGGALRKLISQVVFAAATDESRPALTGVLTKLEGDRIIMVATDGFRLSKREETLLDPVAGDAAVHMLVPAKALAEVSRVIEDDEEPVAIHLTASHGQVMFQTPHANVVAQLIDQKFPPWEAIIPQRYETRITLSTADILKACRQASIFARESADMVRLTIRAGEDLEPGKVTVSARADQTGENCSDLEAVVSGKDLEVGFNVRYLIEGLSAAGTPQVTLDLTQPRSPMVMRAVGDDHFLHILMPMNLPSSN